MLILSDAPYPKSTLASKNPAVHGRGAPDSKCCLQKNAIWPQVYAHLARNHRALNRRPPHPTGSDAVPLRSYAREGRLMTEHLGDFAGVGDDQSLAGARDCHVELARIVANQL